MVWASIAGVCLGHALVLLFYLVFNPKFCYCWLSLVMHTDLWTMVAIFGLICLGQTPLSSSYPPLSWTCTVLRGFPPLFLSLLCSSAIFRVQVNCFFFCQWSLHRGSVFISVDIPWSRAMVPAPWSYTMVLYSGQNWSLSTCVFL